MCIAQGTDRCSCTQQQWCVCSKPQRPGVAIAHDSDAQILFTGGMSYAAVPLYRAFCAATGFAGTPQVGQGKFAPERLVPSETTRRIKVHFNADTSEALPWQFIPSQKYVSVTPGESTLAFYKAHNKSDKDVIGIATYNVTPDRVSWAWTCALRSLMITILL